MPKLNAKIRFIGAALVAALGWTVPGVLAAPPGAAQAEPTSAEEAAAKKQAEEEAVHQKYAALVSTLSPEEQAWEKALQDNLGSFYLPLHKLDAWLASAPGVERWDVIHFNFGIHDRATPVADYTGRLEKIVERLEKTGAKLVWATTTPIPDVPAQNQTAASIVERNAAAATVMEKHGVAIDDLFGFITPHLGEAQLPNDVHFKPEGYDLLGRQVAESIRAVLE